MTNTVHRLTNSTDFDSFLKQLGFIVDRQQSNFWNLVKCFDNHDSKWKIVAYVQVLSSDDQSGRKNGSNYESGSGSDNSSYGDKSDQEEGEAELSEMNMPDKSSGSEPEQACYQFFTYDIKDQPPHPEDKLRKSENKLFKKDEELFFGDD